MVLVWLFDQRGGYALLMIDADTGRSEEYAMPFAPGEEDRLREILGGGEVSATLNVLGRSTVEETAIAGVWWVEHRNALGESLGKTLEITRMPEILFSQPEDVRATLADLDRHMAVLGD